MKHAFTLHYILFVVILFPRNHLRANSSIFNFLSSTQIFANTASVNSEPFSLNILCHEGEISEYYKITDNRIIIYPNPNNETFEIAAQNLASASPFPEGGLRGMKIQVYNSLGELIYSQQINSTDNNFTQTISLNNISSGIYFVYVGDGNNYMHQKIIIE